MDQYVVDDEDEGVTYEFPEGTTKQEVIDFFKKKKSQSMSSKSSMSFLSKIANSGAITDINKFGDFLVDAVNAAVPAIGTIPLKFLPKNKVSDYIESKAKQSDDYFNKKYENNSSALGFKDALSNSILFAAPEADLMETLGATVDALPETITKVLSFLSKKGTQGSLIGIAENNDQNTGEGDAALSGALTNIGAAGILNGAASGLDSFFRNFPKWLGQTVTGKNLLKKIQKLKGAESTGGELLGSAYLKGFQTNVLSRIPGSGQMGKFDKIVAKNKQNASKIYNHFLGEEDSDFLLSKNQQEIKGDMKETQAEMQIKHDQLDNLLEKEDLYPNFKETDKAATDLLNEYNEATELHAPALGNGDIHDILKNYAGISKRLKKQKVDDSISINDRTNELKTTFSKLISTIDENSTKERVLNSHDLLSPEIKPTNSNINELLKDHAGITKLLNRKNGSEIMSTEEITNHLNSILTKLGRPLDEFLGKKITPNFTPSVSPEITPLNSKIQDILQDYIGIYKKLQNETTKSTSSIGERVNELNQLLTKLGRPIGELSEKSGKSIQPEFEPIKSKIKYAKIAKNEIYKRGEEENSAYRKRVYKTLSSALDDDIKAVANKNPTAKKLLTRNDKFYKENLAKYYDPDVVGFTVGNEDPAKTFRSFIKTGKNENPEKMERYIKLLNGKQKKRVVAYSMRQVLDDEGNVDPQKLANYWKSLGGRTKNALFTPPERAALDTLHERVKQNKGAHLQDVQVANGYSNVTANAIKMLATVIAGTHLSAVIPLIAVANLGRSLLDNTKFLKFIANQQMGANSVQNLAESFGNLPALITISSH